MANRADQDFCHTCKTWVEAVIADNLPSFPLVCPKCRKTLFEAEVLARRIQADQQNSGTCATKALRRE